MDAPRRFIAVMLPTISAALVATLAVAAEPPLAGSAFYAATPTYQIPDANRSKPQFVTPSNIAPIRDLRAEREVSGSEPDPETFDKVGLERWWSKHRKAAK